MRKLIFPLLLSVPLISMWASDTQDNTPVFKLNRPEISAPANLAPAPRSLRKGSNILRNAAPAGKIIQGYQSSVSYGVPPGMYRFNTDAETELLYIDDYTLQGYSMTQGWMREGRLCVTAEYYIFSLMDLRYLELDPYTGEILKDEVINIFDPETYTPNYLPYYYSSAYDPANDRVYGYGSSENGMGYAFYSAPGDNPAESICVYTPDFPEVCTSVAFNPVDGYVYGINRNDDFVKIDPETGEQSVIMPSGLSTRYAMAGMIYMENTGKFLLNTLLSDNSSGLAEIDPVAKSVTQLCDFDNYEQYPFIYLVDAADDPNPIKSPEIDEVNFSHGNLSGYISYFIPSEYFTGTPLSGQMQWFASLDGEPYANGTTLAGDIVTVDFTDISEGEHTFGLYVQQDELKSTVCHHTMYVGYDTPLPTASVTLSETMIEWEPVTRCVNGGYLDPASLKYHVYVNDNEIGVTTETSLNYDLPVDAPYASYTAKVIVDNHGMISEPTLSDNIRCGQPWIPDFDITPTPAQAKLFSAFDLNQDKSSWTFYEDDDNPDKGVFYGPYSTISQSNDWLFSPPIKLESNNVSYEISYDLGNFSSWYPDIQVGVYLTNELNPQKIVSTIQEKGSITNTKEYVRYTQRFAVTEPGVYYVAFFCDAEVYQHGIRLQNIEVKRLSTSSDLPAEVTDIKATGAPLGELKATIEFNLPEKFISGKMIPEATEVTAKVILGENEEAVTGRPGQHMEVEIQTQQGYNQFTIKTFIGDEEGNASISNVFTGIDIPGALSSIDGYITEDNLTLVMEWTAPTEGENGYYINPDEIVYNLMIYGEEGWEIAEVIGKNVFRYEYSVPEGSPLRTTFIGIAPSTVAGCSSTVGWLSDVLGTPYDVPALEEFEDGNFKYGPIRIIRLNDEYNNAEWGVVNPALIDPSMEIPSNIACYGRSDEPSTRGMLMLPKFNVQDVNQPGVIFNCWTGKNAAEVTVYGETYDSDGFVTIGTFPTGGNGWQSVEMPFPAEFANHQWVALYVDAFFKNTTDYVLFSSYEVCGDVSAVKEVTIEEGCIRPVAGGIIADGFPGKTISIHTLDGKTVWSGRSGSNQISIRLNSGMYIVCVGNTSTKVCVR